MGDVRLGGAGLADGLGDAEALQELVQHAEVAVWPGLDELPSQLAGGGLLGV